jgi:hypothetical protein
MGQGKQYRKYAFLIYALDKIFGGTPKINATSPFIMMAVSWSERISHGSSRELLRP